MENQPVVVKTATANDDEHKSSSQFNVDFSAAAAIWANSATSSCVHTCSPLHTSEMDSSVDMMNIAGYAGSGALWGANERRVHGSPQAMCGAATPCHRRLTAENKHHIDEQRVCDACYQSHHRHNHPFPASSSSPSAVASSSSSSSYAPVTRSQLPVLPTSYSFATHDWQIIAASDALREVATAWVGMNQDPLASAYTRRYIQSNPHHRQFSVLTARHKWRELGKLADQTERLVREEMAKLMPMEADRLARLHLAAFKVLESDPGYGLQQYHLDCVDRNHADQVISVLIYCTDTMSTEFPRHQFDTCSHLSTTAY
jgi:hypothetical protein